MFDDAIKSQDFSDNTDEVFLKLRGLPIQSSKLSNVAYMKNAWLIVLLFYSAHHVLSAYFHLNSISVPSNHRSYKDRDGKKKIGFNEAVEINTNKVIHSRYMTLFDVGWKCRYMPDVATIMTRKNVNEYRGELLKIKEWVNSRLRHKSIK